MCARAMSSMRVGIDVGGTHTDAVLMDGNSVVAEIKRATTPDVTTGIRDALDGLLVQSAADPASVQAVMIGTTHFTNAVVECRDLLEVATIRLALPATGGVPPLIDWPPRVRAAVGEHIYLCSGGHEFDGREIAPLDVEELRRVGSDIVRKGLRAAAISSVFSPVNDAFERQAAAILQEECPGLAVSLSSEIGRLGLVERENATVLNACLADLAETITRAFESALRESAIDAPLYLSQNDGTLMSVGLAERYPVATFASGPTNSMRGAALLSGERDCAVVDIGGTTTDIGMLVSAFPREAKATVDIGGVRTNFRMPDVLSLGIGGGSLVRPQERFTVGPESVGYELTARARVFGGAELTATDVAVAADQARIGDVERVSHLDRELVRSTLAEIKTRIAEAVDRMKTVAGDIPVVVVGGGSILLDAALPGASRLVRPDHHAVANAVGAAIPQVGGQVDRTYSIGTDLTRERALERAQAEAVGQAVAAGGVADTVRVVDVEELAIAYVPGNALRVKVRAVGDLDLEERAIAPDR
jgi:N-methylhydantoinase A/oxoprolinase/acetone carboxylase beta subunit